MKKTVLDIEEIRLKLPQPLRFLAGKWLIKRLFHYLDIDKVNRIHANHCELRGSAFTSAMLQDPLMDVDYTVHNREILQKLPDKAFITISNHPIGSIDGIILIDLFASIRPDFKVMVNKILAHITAMSDNFISVIHKTSDTQNRTGNTNVIRLALSHLQDGHPLGFFPAGSMSFYNRKEKQVRDLPWSHNVVRLIRKANVPVFPVFFDCLNSNMFYRIGQISWKLRSLFVAREAFNKRGQTLNVWLGDPVYPDKIRSFNDDNDLATFLYDTTYNLKVS